MLKTGALKQSVLEQALSKVGSLETGKLNVAQFLKVIDIIQDDIEIDPAEFPTFDNLSNSVKVEPSKNENEKQAAAKEIYDQIRGNSATLPVSSLLEWDDLNELIKCGALTKRKLSNCLGKIGFSESTTETISFESFYELLGLIDTVADADKIKNILHEGFSDDGEIDLDSTLKMIATGNSPSSTAADIEDDDEEDEDDSVDLDLDLDGIESSFSPADVEDMFKTISKNKPFITEKQLRKWDELVELIDSGFATQAVIDSHLQKLNISKDTKIDISLFEEFVAMLDNVDLDDDGIEIV